MCRCSIFASFHWAFVSKLHIYRSSTIHEKSTQTHSQTNCYVITAVLPHFFCCCCLACRLSVLRHVFILLVSVVRLFICLSVPYFTFHTNSIHWVIRHRNQFPPQTQKRNITIHLTDIHHIWYTYWYCWLILTRIHVKDLTVFSFLLHSIEYRKSNKKPSFLLRINVLMFMLFFFSFRCVCLFSHVNLMSIH